MQELDAKNNEMIDLSFEKFAVKYLLPKYNDIDSYKGYALGYKLFFWGLWIVVWILYSTGHLVLL